MNLIRVRSHDKVSYAPEGAIQKMASGGVRMFSEEGPHLFGQEWPLPSAREVLLSVQCLMESEGLRFGPGTLRFGRADGEYNEFADLTLCPGDKQGIRLTPRTPSDGDIVLSVFPSGRTLPSRFRKEGRRVSVELPWAVPAGERCFVLDETGARLAMVSLPSTSSDKMRLIPRDGLFSWAATVCPDALPEEFQSFSVEEADNYCFVVRQGDKAFKGRLVGDRRDEIKDIRESLRRHGIAGLLSSYQLIRE